MGTTLADAIRYFALVESMVLIGFSTATMVEASKFRTPSLYNYLVALSYVGMILAVDVELVGHLGAPLTWRAPFVVVILSFGIGSMLMMYRYYNPTLRELRHQAISTRIAANRMQELLEEKEDGKEG